MYSLTSKLQTYVIHSVTFGERTQFHTTSLQFPPFGFGRGRPSLGNILTRTFIVEICLKRCNEGLVELVGGQGWSRWVETGFCG